VSEELTPVDVLRQARDAVASSGAWCQGLYYRGDDGFAATTCCSIGWICKIATGSATRWSNIAGRAAEALENVIPGLSISTWNDAYGRTQAEVVAGFDAAIAYAERVRS